MLRAIPAPRRIAARPLSPPPSRGCRVQASISPRSSGRVDAQRMRLVELGERRRRIAGEDQLQQPADASAVGEAEHVADLVGGHRSRAMRDRLVEDRKPVAGRTFGGPGDHASASGSTSTPSAFDDVGEMRGQLLGRNPPQVETLAARQHRHRHLVHLGRREQELHMLRRLLKSLQQRIESVLRKHVDFVDDVDLVARADRRVADRVDDLANIVDAGVRRRRPSRSRRYAGPPQSPGTARRRCTA